MTTVINPIDLNTDDMSREDLKRRSFMKNVGVATGGASTLALAGCLGEEEDPVDDPDDDDDVDPDPDDDDDDDEEPVEYPTDDIRNIVPYASGGGFDAYARLIEPYFEEYLGTEVVTENITGGGGVTGGTEAYTSDPDGHTIVIWAPGEALPSQIGQDVGYDIRDMSHIGFLTQTPCALILRDDTEIETWDEFVENLEDLNFATQGVGTMAHVGIDILGGLTGEYDPGQANYVHYGGTGEVLAGLERGEANAFLITAGDSGANVVQGVEGTNLFLVFDEEDNTGWYFDDAGVEVVNWAPDLGIDGMDDFGIVAGMRRFYSGPPEVPDDILEIQREAFMEIVEDEDFLEDTTEADRPVIEPGDHTVVENVIEESYDILTSDPYQGILEDAFE